jgi:MinD superfamily P-loop ATPase
MKIAIASGKGGTGKTFVSTNLFYIAQKQGLKTCLVDCDAEEPNVFGFLLGKENYKIPATQKIPVFDKEKCTFCKKCSEYCEYNAIFILPMVQFIQVTPELCHNCGACLYACEFDAITETEIGIGEITCVQFSENAEIIESRMNIGIERAGEIINFAQKQVPKNTELVIYDSPPGTSCPFISTVEKADIVLMVAEPTPFGLNDLKLSVDVLKQIGKAIYAIINKHGIGNDEVEKFLEAENIEIVAKIPFDRNIAELYSEGKILAKDVEKYTIMFENVLINLLMNKNN